MAWGYSPRRVVKWRETRLETEKKKGPGFLLVLVGICAAIFVFGLVSEIMRPGEKEKQEDLMIRINGDVKEEQDLLVKPNADWDKTEESLDKKYRILWKKPADTGSPVVDSWEQTQKEKQRREQVKEEGNWDENP